MLGARVSVIRGRRRQGSCVVSSFIGGDVPLPAAEVAWPGRDAFLRPGGARGVRPFAVLLLPARLRGRRPPRRIPLAVSRHVRPDNFRRGIGRASPSRSGSCHPRSVRATADRRTFAAAPGFVCPREQSVPSSRVSFGARRLVLAAAVTALGFASVRCSGRRCAARTGSTPFRAIGLRSEVSMAMNRRGVLYRFRFLSARGF